MNSRGSPLAQVGRMTSPSLVPFCLAPGAWKAKEGKSINNKAVNDPSQFLNSASISCDSDADPGQSYWSLAGTRADRRTPGWAPWRRPCCVWKQRARLHERCGTSCQPGRSVLPVIHTKTHFSPQKELFLRVKSREGATPRKCKESPANKKNNNTSTVLLMWFHCPLEFSDLLFYGA